MNKYSLLYKPFSILLLLILISCNKVESDVINFNVKLKSLDDDIFQLFYIDDPKLSYTDSLLIRKKIIGKDQFQDLTFKIMSKKNILKLRFDIGEKGLNSGIVIESINIGFAEKSILVNESNFHRFFSPNIFINTQNFRSFKRKSINGKYDPFFLSKALLEKKMQIEFR